MHLVVVILAVCSVSTTFPFIQIVACFLCKFPVVVGVPCAGVGMLTMGTARACCVVSASRVAFDFAGTPSRIFAYTGG